MAAAKNTPRKRATSSSRSRPRAGAAAPAAALARAEAKVATLARIEAVERVVHEGRPVGVELEPRVCELERHVIGRELEGDLEHRLANLERLTGREGTA